MVIILLSGGQWSVLRYQLDLGSFVVLFKVSLLYLLGLKLLLFGERLIASQF